MTTDHDPMNHLKCNLNPYLLLLNKNRIFISTIIQQKYSSGWSEVSHWEGRQHPGHCSLRSQDGDCGGWGRMLWLYLQGQKSPYYSTTVMLRECFVLQDVKQCLPSIIILIVGLTLMVLFIPYAFASVIRQIQREEALKMMTNDTSTGEETDQSDSL